MNQMARHPKSAIHIPERFGELFLEALQQKTHSSIPYYESKISNLRNEIVKILPDNDPKLKEIALSLRKRKIINKNLQHLYAKLEKKHEYLLDSSKTNQKKFEQSLTRIGKNIKESQQKISIIHQKIKSFESEFNNFSVAISAVQESVFKDCEILHKNYINVGVRSYIIKTAKNEALNEFQNKSLQNKIDHCYFIISQISKAQDKIIQKINFPPMNINSLSSKELEDYIHELLKECSVQKIQKELGGLSNNQIDLMIQSFKEKLKKQRQYYKRLIKNQKNLLAHLDKETTKAKNCLNNLHQTHLKAKYY